MVHAHEVNGELRCGTRDCPGRLGRLIDRQGAGTVWWKLDLPFGWVFAGWQLGDDRGGGPEVVGGHWEVTPRVQARYDELRQLQRRGLLSPSQRTLWQQGPRALAQANDAYDPS